MATPSFKLPKSFLTQLGEFSHGYVLIVVNEQGEFESFMQADTPAVRLGIIRFAEIVAGKLNATLEEGLEKPEAQPEDPDDADPLDGISLG